MELNLLLTSANKLESIYRIKNELLQAEEPLATYFLNNWSPAPLRSPCLPGALKVNEARLNPEQRLFRALGRLPAP